MGLSGCRSRGIRVGTWYDYKSTLEAFSFLRFAYAEVRPRVVVVGLAAIIACHARLHQHQHLHLPLRTYSPVVCGVTVCAVR